MREVDLRTFAAAREAGDGQVYVLDVRERYEFAAGHVPGAVLMPLGTVPERRAELPTDRPVYVICATGNRSYAAAAWLAALGVDAWSVAGGTDGWRRLGGAVDRGTGDRDWLSGTG